MSTQYQLSCECGKKSAVSVSQAGNTLQCECGRALSVPTLRILKTRPVVAPTDAGLEPGNKRGNKSGNHAKSARNWRPIQGVVFGTGTVIAIISLAFVFYWGRDWISMPDVRPMIAQDSTQAWSARIDELSLEHSWEFWDKMSKTDMGEQHPPPHFLIDLYTKDLQQKIFYAAAAALVGILLAAISLII